MTTTTERPSLLEVVAHTRPRLTRVFGDEDAFTIIGAVAAAIQEIGRAIGATGIGAAKNEVTTEMVSGDYEHLLDVARRYVKFADDEDD